MGITKLTPGWNTLLQQVGAGFKEIKSVNKINLEDYALIIISSDLLTKQERNILYEYAAEGGAVIAGASCASSIFKIKVKHSYLKFLYSETDDIFYKYQICDLYKYTKIPVKGNHLENQDKEKALLSFAVEKGNVFVFPDDLVSSIHKTGFIRKNFYSPFSSKPSSEVVSKVSKGIIRIHVQRAMQYLFHKRNLPFIHLWFFPDGAKNIFSFRIDTDMGKKEEIIELNNLMQNFGIPATWFVETKTAKDWIELYSTFKDQEISFHCYRHRTFLTRKKNEEDIKTGLKILSDASIIPKGYAAPYGKWNRTIAEVIDSFNFLYSSEFDFAYDSLPLYPFYNSSFSKTLQIPIHPLSMGRLHWSGHSEEDMIKYFYDIINQKLIFNDPIILYTHPFEKRFSVLEKIFKKIGEYEAKEYFSDKIVKLTFFQYVEWWKKRLEINWEAEEKDGSVSVSSKNADDRFKWRIIYPSGEKYLLSLNSGELKIDEQEYTYHPDFNPNELREKTFQMFKYDLIGKLRKLRQ